MLTRISRRQPLILASFENRTSVLELLLRAGANVQLQQRHGLTALHAAAQHGNAQAVGMMLAADAQVDARHQPSGLTALMLAAQHGHAAVVKLLLEAGADRRLQDKAGDTAMAIEQGMHTQMKWANRTNCRDRLAKPFALVY